MPPVAVPLLRAFSERSSQTSRQISSVSDHHVQFIKREKHLAIIRKQRGNPWPRFGTEN